MYYSRFVSQIFYGLSITFKIVFGTGDVQMIVDLVSVLGDKQDSSFEGDTMIIELTVSRLVVN